MSRLTVEDRFWSKVNVAGPNECWLWGASKNKDGYGWFRLGRKMTRSHKVAFELVYGVVPEGLCVLHNCPDGDNPACCNPAHLWLGDHGDNMRDMIAKGRRKEPRGDAHWSRHKPECLARGDRSGSRLHPDRLYRGEQVHLAKLTEGHVREIRARYAEGGTTHSKLAELFSVTKATVGRVLRGATWRHVK